VGDRYSPASLGHFKAKPKGSIEVPGKQRRRHIPPEERGTRRNLGTEDQEEREKGDCMEREPKETSMKNSLLKPKREKTQRRRESTSHIVVGKTKKCGERKRRRKVSDYFLSFFLSSKLIQNQERKGYGNMSPRLAENIREK